MFCDSFGERTDNWIENLGRGRPKHGQGAGSEPPVACVMVTEKSRHGPRILIPKRLAAKHINQRVSEEEVRLEEQGTWKQLLAKRARE